MPIFISYSHQDKTFVDDLAKQLVAQNVHVWLDRWELNIGDSILEKVQEAIDESSALLVILSKSSTASEWCKKEINGGLLKELEEKRVFVLPILLEDCEIPLFARGKLYADFRSSHDDGLRTVLEGIAKITNPNLARFKEPEYHIDYAEDWGGNDDTFTIRLTYVEQAKGQPYTCLTIINIYARGEAKEIYDSMHYKGKGQEGRFEIIKALHEEVSGKEEIRPLLNDEFEKTIEFPFEGKSGEIYFVVIGARRLGEDTGRDILVNTSNLIERTYNHMKEVLHTKE